MPNPRSKEQVEPRQQFFACYDAQKHFLYMNDYNKKGFVEQYLSDHQHLNASIEGRLVVL